MSYPDFSSIKFFAGQGTSHAVVVAQCDITFGMVSEKNDILEVLAQAGINDAMFQLTLTTSFSPVYPEQDMDTFTMPRSITQNKHHYRSGAEPKRINNDNRYQMGSRQNITPDSSVESSIRLTVNGATFPGEKILYLQE